MRGFFITGTDTDIGKTFVAAGILRYLRGRGVDAVPMKPVQTGAVKTPGGWRSPDLEFCLDVAGIAADPEARELMSPCNYEIACSPHLAGKLAGSYPEVSRIASCAEKLAALHDMILVEGAGGVLVPINENETMLDLMKALALPVILVARAGLGTINHSLLSLKVLRDAGMRVAGIVFNHAAPTFREDAFIREDNVHIIRELGGVEVLGSVRYAGKTSAADFPGWFAEDVPGLDSLI